MHKIVAAVNSMISNEKLITHTIKSGEGLFFLYDEKFKWSIFKANDDYYLSYYLSSQTLEQLASRDEWNDYGDYIVYSTKEIKTREVRESFAELYQTVQTKLYGIDEVLDYIINTAA